MILNRTKNGFTLVELILVLAIFVLLTSVVMVGFSNINIGAQLNENRDNLVQNVRTARERSVVGLNATSHGMKILSDRFVLYQGASYEDRDSTYDREIIVGPAITLTSTLTNNEVNFSKGLGAPSVTGTITLTHSAAGTRTITINGQGKTQ